MIHRVIFTISLLYGFTILVHLISFYEFLFNFEDFWNKIQLDQKGWIWLDRGPVRPNQNSKFVFSPVVNFETP